MARNLGSEIAREFPKKYKREAVTARRLSRTLEHRLTAAERQRFLKARDRLDRAFLFEKCELVLDTMLEIETRRNESTTLLQRNVWATLDAIALHLDYSGFTSEVTRAASKMLKPERLDDPALMDIEWKGILTALKVDEAEMERKWGIPRYEFDEVAHEAEQSKSGTCGWKNITAKDFTFQNAFAAACGRPDKMLEIHHSPQSKAFVAIVIGVINLICCWVPCWPIAIVTLIILIVVLCTGC